MPWATYLVDIERDEDAVYTGSRPPSYVCGIGRGTWRKMQDKSEIKMPSNAVRGGEYNTKVSSIYQQKHNISFPMKMMGRGRAMYGSYKTIGKTEVKPGEKLTAAGNICKREHEMNFSIPKLMGRGRGMYSCYKTIGKTEVKPGGKLTAKIAPTTQPRKPLPLTDYKLKQLTNFVKKTTSISNQNSWAHRAGTLFPELETVEAFNKKLDKFAELSNEEAPFQRIRKKKTAIVKSFDLAGVVHDPDEDEYAGAVGGVPDVNAALKTMSHSVRQGNISGVKNRTKDPCNVQNSIYEDKAIVPICADRYSIPVTQRKPDEHQTGGNNSTSRGAESLKSGAEDWDVEEAYCAFVNESIQSYQSFNDELFSKGPCVFEVANLPFDVSETTLYEFMCSFGEVILCEVDRSPPDYCNGARARVRMATKRGCQFAVNCLHGEVSPFPGIYNNDIIPVLVCTLCD
ncbi:uncharacterized protein LOC100369310 [Saccoglossus kowalevskii]|uniref:Uncharacterized protein LOC100369310 n=1 Tax=Saccoglossus kowalevskii TaxID=10224 RepID=A0ABM0GMR5_SACKO|nr:PREDICTED: uncharacterized protein LOC100369310 [Saccoglossus kowalevskii]